MSPSERTLKYLAEAEPMEIPQSLYDFSEQLRDHDNYFDRDGQPITFIQWMLLSHRDYKLVKQENIGPLFVSTVWLGMDSGFGFTDKPVIFETMVFDQRPEGLAKWHDIEQRRYCSEEEALAGHEEICAQVRLLEELR